MKMVENNDLYVNAIKALGDYSSHINDNSLIRFDYSIDNDVKHMLNYKYLSKVKSNSELPFYLTLTRWVYETLLYSRECNCNIDPLSSINILDCAKINKVSVNCLCHSVVLAQSLLAVGYKARCISCLPMDGLTYDNHVVVEVFIEDIQKWVLLDSSLGFYVTNANDEMLSLIEFRSNLLHNKLCIIKYLTRFSKIGVPNTATLVDTTHIHNLYLRNFFVLEYYPHCTYGFDQTKVFRLVPEGYMQRDIKKEIWTCGNKREYIYTNNVNDFY